MDTLKLVLGLLVLVAVVYFGILLVPPYFSNYEFQDFIQNEAVQATYTPKAEDAIRDTVLKKAQDLDIPLTKEQIKVVRIGSQNTGSVSITANYTVHLSIPGYPTDLHFTASTSNKSTF